MPKTQRVSRLSLAVLLAVALSACTVLTEDDRARLRLLERTFGHADTFSAEDVYLSVHARTPDPDAWDRWLEMYRTFWLYNGSPRHSTALVYMNVYDSMDVWQGQFSWDPAERLLVFSHDREHY